MPSLTRSYGFFYLTRVIRFSAYKTTLPAPVPSLLRRILVASSSGETLFTMPAHHRKHIEVDLLKLILSVILLRLCVALKLVLDTPKAMSRNQGIVAGVDAINIIIIHKKCDFSGFQNSINI